MHNCAMHLDCWMTLLSLVLDSASTAFRQVPRPMLIFRLTDDLQLVISDLVWKRHTQRWFTNISDAPNIGLATSTSAWAWSTSHWPLARCTTCHFHFNRAATVTTNICTTNIYHLTDCSSPISLLLLIFVWHTYIVQAKQRTLNVSAGSPQCASANHAQVH